MDTHWTFKWSLLNYKAQVVIVCTVCYLDLICLPFTDVSSLHCHVPTFKSL